MTLLLLQITVALLAAHTCGWMARKLGQAQVVGEMIGGILIGPSLFGRLMPHAHSLLFPANSWPSFEILSTFGLILFLFLVGVELDHGHLRQHKATAVLASGLSILFPFVLAVAVAPFLRVRFAPAQIGALPFTLFLGICMSVTAFPVLARIVEERGLQRTPLGSIAIMCAAVDDVCAWTLLAIALATLPGPANSLPATYRLMLLGAYLVAMIFIIRPVAAKLAAPHKDKPFSQGLLALAVAFAFASAAATEAIGVHPLFGAFLAGTCFPRVEQWQSAIRMRMETVVSTALLPLFFALTGMRTRLDLINSPQAWFWAAVVLFLAIAGKVGGAAMAALWAGHSLRQALALGALLDTRGLVELVVLNVAYDAHVFSPTLFTMLVIMALFTTMITTPILDLLQVRGDLRHPSIQWMPLRRAKSHSSPEPVSK
jgi:Kef-type K+ transport system membrane component KefB